ncbi:MAG: YebC/PmpR family DNA-binding transcriptional regulator, partial [Crocosphaera sp.]
AIEKAKAAGIPNDNIERAIAKGAGTYENDDTIYEEIRYEGYGVGGVAILIEAFTDNRNRTAADLRSAFTKNGGNLGETGCVGWMFEQKGVVRVEGVIDENALLEASMEGEADSYELYDEVGEQGAEVFTDMTNLNRLSQTLNDQNFNVTEAELRWIPNNLIEIEDNEQAKSIIKLIEALESLDDVQNVTANFEMADELIFSSIN